MTEVERAISNTELDNESLEEERAKQERLGIVNKYAKGPEANEGDEFVNPNASDIPDQYGFLLNSEPAPLSKQEEDRRRLIEVKRRTKWLKMVRHWDKYVGSEKLAKRIYKGIPQGMRGDVWKLLLGVDQYMENMPDAYQEMKTRAHSHSNDIRQIDLDVNRTYRDHVMFRKRYSIKQQQLFHVLAAYSMYNTEVGYCQGMSQIAALLLMYMSEEEAFWALHSLLYGEKHKMHGFFIPGFPKLLRFQNHHDRILKKLMPKLKKHLDENEVFASLYTMKWFFQCFLDRSPFSLTLRLWDIYVLEGEKLLISMSYATLKLHKVYIKSQDMDGIVSFLQEQLVKDFGASDDMVVEHLRSCMIDLRRTSLDQPPSATDVEKPKLPFGSFAPTTEKAAHAKVPEFAKHAVDIETLLPELKRKGSKKKREKVKRGKSAVGKNAIAANGTELPVPNLKDSKSFKDPEHLTRSPFLRGSLRKHAKTEKIKNSKSPSTPSKVPTTKTRDGDKKKSKTDGTKSSQSSPVPKPQNGTRPKARQTDSNMSSGDNTTDSTLQNKNSAPVLLPTANGSGSSPKTPVSKLPKNEHKNNSNNFKSSDKQKNSTEPFVPAILSQKTSTSSDPASELTSSSFEPPSPKKKVPTKRQPRSPAKIQHNFSSTLPHPNAVVTEDEPDGRTQTLKSSSEKRTGQRSQSSDLKSSPTKSVKSKAPSFTQLSAALDSIENVSQVYSQGFSTPSDSSTPTRSPVHQLTTVRPQSFYDNVPYESSAGLIDQISPGSSATMHNSSKMRSTKYSHGRKNNFTGNNNSKSMDNLQTWKEERRKTTAKTKVVPASYTPFNRGDTSPPSQPSPFQKAVQETGILNIPNRHFMGRRMSREEVVTAAIISQMESKKSRSKTKKTKVSSQDVSKDLNTWRLERSRDGAPYKASRMGNQPSPKKRHSLGADELLMSQIEKQHSGDYKQAKLVKSPSKKRNASMEFLGRDRKKSWKTTEVDDVFQMGGSRSVEGLSPTPVATNLSPNPVSFKPSFSSEVRPYRHASESPSGLYMPDNNRSPELSPSSFSISSASKAQINQLLSVGINADPNILRQYNGTSPKSSYNGQYFTHRSYQSNIPDSRRRSVNMGVQTEESRIV